jgi:hypothetical protein
MVSTFEEPMEMKYAKIRLQQSSLKPILYQLHMKRERHVVPILSMFYYMY